MIDKELCDEINEIKKHLLNHYEMLKSIHRGFYCKECEKVKKDLMKGGGG